MKNIYLIYGLEDYLINEYKKEIINSIKVNNIINYDLSIDDLSDVLYEITSVSLFNKEKVIICENCTFLTSNSKKEDENKVKELIKYLNNPFDDVYILFIINSEKLDVRKKIVKELKTKSKVYEAKKIENYDLNNFLLKYISDRDYKISNKNISLLISIAGYNLQILINEINKLFLYKGDNKTIEEDDIRNLVTTNIENNIFSLTNSFLDNNKEKTINIYNDLLKAGIKHEAIIGTISNQLRLLLQVSLMKKMDILIKKW